ncbi:hypothetical protein DFJ74DRAFT_336299 [Hyaloraphidium curvatum]|nr:hypothetical protein DFJ74DRAFT_336299 [Hyaloraphidium curvatum]
MGPTSHEDSLHIPSSDWWVFKAPDQLCPRYVVYFEPTGRAVPGMAVVPPALAGGTGSSAYLANLLAQAKQKVATLGVPVPGLAAAPYGNLPYLAAGPSYAALPYAPPLPRPRKGKHRVPYLPAQLPPAAYQAPPPPTLPGAFPSSPPPRPRSPTPPAAAVPADVEAALSASLDDIQQPSHATPQATRAIQRQLMRIVASQMSARKEGEGGVVLDVEGMQNLYLWRVRFTNFDPNTSLARDLASIGRKHVDVELRFGPEYPERPPFIRVVAPRFVPLVNGGGGHVTAGGSVCYKKLTVGGDGKENWSPNTDLETLLLGIREGLLSGEPPARVDVRNPTGTYALNEAVAAYDRTIMMHAHQGWGRDGRMASWVYK